MAGRKKSDFDSELADILGPELAAEIGGEKKKPSSSSDDLPRRSTDGPLADVATKARQPTPLSVGDPEPVSDDSPRPDRAKPAKTADVGDDATVVIRRGRIPTGSASAPLPPGEDTQELSPPPKRSRPAAETSRMPDEASAPARALKDGPAIYRVEAKGAGSAWDGPDQLGTAPDLSEEPARRSSEVEGDLGALPRETGLGHTTDEFIDTSRRARFPSQQVERASLAISERLSALSPEVQIGLAVGLLALFVVFVAVLAFSGDESISYVTAEVTLRAGPDAGDAYVEVGRVKRGEQVEVLDQVDAYVLVRDESGRVGYIAEAFLDDDVPVAAPNEPFRRCTQLATELSSKPCEQRGAAQFEACQELCDDGPDLVPCPNDCTALREACVTSCRAVVPDTSAETSPEEIADPEDSALAPVRTKAKVRAQSKKRSQRKKSKRKKSKRGRRR